MFENVVENLSGEFDGHKKSVIRRFGTVPLWIEASNHFAKRIGLAHIADEGNSAVIPSVNTLDKRFINVVPKPFRVR